MARCRPSTHVQISSAVRTMGWVSPASFCDMVSQHVDRSRQQRIQGRPAEHEQCRNPTDIRSPAHTASSVEVSRRKRLLQTTHSLVPLLPAKKGRDKGKKLKLRGADNNGAAVRQVQLLWRTLDSVRFLTKPLRPGRDNVKEGTPAAGLSQGAYYAVLSSHRPAPSSAGGHGPTRSRRRRTPAPRCTAWNASTS